MVPQVRRQVGVGREGTGPSPPLVSTGPTAPGEPQARFIANERGIQCSLLHLRVKGGGGFAESDDAPRGPGPAEVSYFTYEETLYS
jgi:hypothetical protein